MATVLGAQLIDILVMDEEVRAIVYFRRSKISEICTHLIIILYHNNQLFPVVSYSETLNLIVVASWSSCTWSRPSCSSNECSGGTRGCCMAGRSCWWSYHKYECYRYIPNWLCIWKAQNSGYSIHVHYQTKCLLLGILSIVVLSEKWF